MKGGEIMELTFAERTIVASEEYKAKKKVTPIQLLKVPNNWIGKLFLWYFRRHLNRETYRMRCRGRKPRKSQHNSLGFVPLTNAKQVGVYVDFKQNSGHKTTLREGWRWS